MSEEKGRVVESVRETFIQVSDADNIQYTPRRPCPVLSAERTKMFKVYSCVVPRAPWCLIFNRMLQITGKVL